MRFGLDAMMVERRFDRDMSIENSFVGNVKFDLRGDSDATLAHMRNRVPPAGFVHLLHPDRSLPIDTLSRIAWNDPNAKALLVELTNMGYYAYLSRDGESRLVHRSRFKDLWAPLRDGQYEEDPSGQIFEYSRPLSGKPADKLLVIFSSVFDPALSSSLSRYFNRTFLTNQKYLPRNVGVLRIADIGGVLGAFYMNTRFRPDNESTVSGFIKSFMKSQGLREQDVVLYGASKGGTASLAYGLRSGLKFVAVDPIVDDRYYHLEHNDLHFTETSIFLESKVDMFDNIYNRFLTSFNGSPRVQEGVSRSIICSEGSPLYPYLEGSAVHALREHVSFFRSRNPDITTHPGVAQNTINVLTMLLNAYFYDQRFPSGVIDID